MNHTSESEKLPQVAQFPAKRLKGKKKKKQNKTIIHTKIEEICQKNKTELKTSNTRNIKTKLRNTHQSHAYYSYFSTAKKKKIDMNDMAARNTSPTSEAKRSNVLEHNTCCSKK